MADAGTVSYRTGSQARALAPPLKGGATLDHPISAACAAASRAIGTRKGEHDT
jgi:hypothetical protein